MSTGYVRGTAGTTGVSASVTAEESRATVAENARRNRFVDQGAAKTAFYTMAAWHSTHYDCTSGSIAQPLPSSPVAGDEVELYLDATSAAHVLTATSGGTIATLSEPGHGITLRYNGTTWKEGPDRKSLSSLDKMYGTVINVSDPRYGIKFDGVTNDTTE